MKRIIYTLFGLFGLAIALTTACTDPNAESAWAKQGIVEGMNVGDMLASKPEFTSWVEILKKAGSFDALNVAYKYTCFAVDNDAVQTYMTEKGLTEIDEATAKALVRYHVLPNSQIAYDQISNGRFADSTASGDYLTSMYVTEMVPNTDSMTTVIYVNRESRIVPRGDLDVINGYVHELDKMLDPIITSVWTQLSEDPAYSIFAEAVERTNYDSILHQEYYYIQDTVNHTTTRIRRQTTVFAITDARFAEEGINSFADLEALFGNGNTNYESPANPINTYIGYHIANGFNAFSDLATFPNQATAGKRKNLNSAASGQIIQVEEEGGIIYLNRIDSLTEYGGAELDVNGRGDIQARNGVRHDTKGLLPLFTPPPTTVKIEFTDRLLWPEWTTVHNYRVNYPGTSLAEGYNTLVRVGQIPAMRWWSADGTGTVTYHIRSASWGTTVDNQDVLAIDMKGTGWWEIDLPAIVAGTYSVVVRSNDGFDRGRWQMAIDIDGKMTNVGGVYVAYNTAFAPVMHNVTPALTFPTTATHTLRFTQVDMGRVELDYITFTPVQ